MKLKSSLFIVAATAGLASSAHSQTVIDICGSTAGRAAVYSKVLASLVGGVQTSSAGSGSSLSGSNQAIIFGNYDADGAGGNPAVPVIIRTNFTGSAAGVDEVANQKQVSFFKTTIGTSGNTTGVSFTNAANIETSAPEIGYSDVFQSTTAFAAPLLAAEDEVAVIAFKFYKSSDGDSNLTGVTSQQVRNIYGAGGSAPLSTFTGNLNHTSLVYATGRDSGSGTRITTFAETATSQTAVSQYGVGTSPLTFSGGSDGTGAVSSLGTTSTSGYDSGSKVAAVLNSTFSGGTIIGYLGGADWPSTPTNNAKELTFNGVTYSPEAVYEGQYSFWGYLHMFRPALSGTASSFYTSVKDAITANPGLPGVLKIDDMHAVRDSDGGYIYPFTP